MQEATFLEAMLAVPMTLAAVQTQAKLAHTLVTELAAQMILAALPIQGLQEQTLGVVLEGQMT